MIPYGISSALYMSPVKEEAMSLPTSPMKKKFALKCKSCFKVLINLSVDPFFNQDENGKVERKSPQGTKAKVSPIKLNNGLINPFSLTVSKSVERGDGLTNKYLGFLKRPEDRGSSPSNNTLRESKDILSKENKVLKQEVSKIRTDLKELDTENLKLKEEVNSQVRN